jgi:FkbM family methyltransferase
MLSAWAMHSPALRAAVPNYVGSRFLAGSKNAVRSASGRLFAVEPSAFGLYLAMIRGGSNYPSHVLETCRLHLQPGGTLYDVGANIGFISIEVACSGIPNLNVYAFEPQPRLAEKIAISGILNRTERLEVFDLVLGDEIGTAQIHVGRNPSHTSLVPRGSGCQSVSGLMMTVDELVFREIVVPPSLIKLDVEGAELLVLKGAREVCVKYRPYLVFECDSNMVRFGYEKSDLFDLIRSFGEYSFYDIVEGDDGRLIRFAAIHNSDESTCDDVLAVPVGRPLHAPREQATSPRECS